MIFGFFFLFFLEPGPKVLRVAAADKFRRGPKGGFRFPYLMPL
jgi:hypothetical protein